MYLRYLAVLAVHELQSMSEGVWKRVWNSLAGLGQHTSVAIQTFQGAKSKVWVDVAHYSLNPPLTANRGK